ncbi:hypothetical protein RclHR1_30130002 [Rhizophagus clarus]|uniref:Uncharacterized protein n=1 Tax=Rhizophagus clarus TaxID=94130 RepID=A0A2Z6R5D6_9GLOM|nr:hypothetical protein RclHR1_30130002 [Rhizophagus clarus]
MKSERQTERIPEGLSEKDLSNNLLSDLEELTKETRYTMTDNNDRDGIDITLNCLIVPIGNLFNLPSNQVAQAITINTGQRISVLENAIHNQLNQLGLLGVQFSNLSLSIRQIHPGTVSERPMNSQAYISDFFNDPFQP